MKKKTRMKTSLYIIQFVLLHLILLPLAGCVSSHSAYSFGVPLTRSDAIGALEGLIVKNQRAKFVSRDGTCYCVDSDTIISFEENNTVILGEYGYTYVGYSGTYEISEDGILSLNLPAYPKIWPKMQMSFDGQDYRLHTTDKDNSFILGGRSGAAVSSDMKPFWPFRLISDTTAIRRSPVRRTEVLASFCNPYLSSDVRWLDDRISFRIELWVNEDGSTKVEGCLIDGVSHKQLPVEDWRLLLVDAALSAVKKWNFLPYLVDGNPSKTMRGYTFSASKKEGSVWWVIKDVHGIIFDNIPHETIVAEIKADLNE